MSSNDSPYRMAEATLAICNVLSDLDVTAWAIDVADAGRRVTVHIDHCDVASVDLLGVHLHLAHDDRVSSNYTRAGDALVYGHPLRVTVFCGRPESMRVAS